MFYIFIVIFLLPFIELYLLLWVAQVLGAWNAFSLIMIAGIIGIMLVRWTGVLMHKKFISDMRKGIIPAESMFDAFIIFLCGVLLVIPGFITDIIGLALLIPFFRNLLKHWIKGRMVRKRSSYQAEYRVKD